MISNIDNLRDFTTHAERFQQGGRNVYAFTATLSEINNLLPDRSPEEEGKVIDANRRLTPSHALRIQRYLAERPDWLISSILAGVDPENVEFNGYSNKDGTINSDIGELGILKTRNGEKALILFDGQHRRRAIRDLMRSIDLNGDDLHIRNLANSKIPILIYEESLIDKLREMFLDHGQSKAPEANTNTRFDQQNPFNLAAVALVEDNEYQSNFFQTRVEMERTQAPRSSHCIIAINQLARAIKNCELGYKGRLSKDRQLQYHQEGIEVLYQRCLDWSDDFMPKTRREYNDLYNGFVVNSEIPDLRVKSLAYNATVVQVLAGCYYEWRKDNPDWEPLAQFLRDADFTPGRDVNEGALLVDADLVPPKGITPFPRIQEVTRAIDYIVGKAKEFAGEPSTK